jgi:hypothetical protein
MVITHANGKEKHEIFWKKGKQIGVTTIRIKAYFNGIPALGHNSLDEYIS